MVDILKYPGSGGGGSIGGPIIGGTPGAVLFIDASGNLGQDPSNFFWQDTLNFLGLGISPPISNLHVNGPAAAPIAGVQLTVPASGTGFTDGLYFGMATDTSVVFLDYEDSTMDFYTDGAARMRIHTTANGGRVIVGDVDESAPFFPTTDQKFLVNNTITTIGTNSPTTDFIKLMSVTSGIILPSADTNSGLGLTLYAAQGFSLDVNSTHQLNGGVAVGGAQVTGEPASVLGAFGQVNFNSAAGITADGIIGLLCTGAHQSGGGTVTQIVGGDFGALGDGASVSSLTGTGTITTGIGGRFTCNTSGPIITTGISGRFDEPVGFDGGGGAGAQANPTNRTSIECRGTVTFKIVSVTTAASMTNISVSSSHLRLDTTNATPALHGFHADTFSKHIWIIVPTGVTATLKHQSATDGTAANRVQCKTGLDTIYAANTMIELVYDTTSSFWREV